MKISAVFLSLAVVMAAADPTLWPVVALGFFQNLAHTFVSRGRNSGSLGYHVVAAVFSNGIYISLLVLSINMVAYTQRSLAAFVVAYTAATMSGSVLAHAAAMKFERGKARNIQADAHAELERRVKKLEVLWSR